MGSEKVDGRNSAFSLRVWSGVTYLLKRQLPMLPYSAPEVPNQYFCWWDSALATRSQMILMLLPANLMSMFLVFLIWSFISLWWPYLSNFYSVFMSETSLKRCEYSCSTTHPTKVYKSNTVTNILFAFCSKSSPLNIHPIAQHLNY